MISQALTRLALRLNSRPLVEALYLALLGRTADPQGLDTYSSELAKDGDLTGVARSISGSEEAWNKALGERSSAIVTAAFRGLLGRDPDAEALAAYSASFADQRNLAAMLDDIGRSDEHWRRLLALHADIIVRTLYKTLLEREPDPEFLAVHAQQLRQSADLSALTLAITRSADQPDSGSPPGQPVGSLLRSDDLPALLAEVAHGSTAWNELSALRYPQSGPAHEALAEEAWVFIHAQKTGGTSVQNMLAEVFGDRKVYREKGDTLFRRSPAELAQFSVFAGHFDFNSVSYIPRRTRHLITFLREPRRRLLSLYRFLRAHQPGSPDFNGRKQIANLLDAETFFRSVMALAGGDLWNHLTWCVMGQRKWNAYRQLLSDSNTSATAQRLDEIRVDVRSRLQEFAFIGLQEDFAHSCRRLFEMIGTRVPHLRHDHLIESMTANTKHFKQVPLPSLTPQLQDALSPLVQIDDIVYQEGCDLYHRKWDRIAHAEAYRKA
jgi:hypothetical protein